MAKLIGRHSYSFNPHDNGGEQLQLHTEFFQHEGEAPFTNQQLTLQSYGNMATLTLCGVQITPENLRSLANQLDAKAAELKGRARVGSETKV